MKRGIALGVAVLACVSVAACASTADPDVSTSAQGAMSAEEFWPAHRLAAHEVDPAGSLSELGERATSIVVGRVVESQAGPDFPVEMDDGTVDLNETTVLTVAVDQTLKGEPATEVKVWVGQASPDANALTEAQLPEDHYVWFLIPSEEVGLTYLVSQTGVVGPLASNVPETVLDPGLTEDIVPPDVDSVPELTEVIEGQ